MARKKMSARAAVIDVLEKEGKPLHVSEIAKRVLAGYTTGLKGKTPEASIAAMLHTSATKGVDFKKTKPGTFALRAQHARPSAVQSTAPAVRPTVTRSRSARPDPKPSAAKNQRRRRTRRQQSREPIAA